MRREEAGMALNTVQKIDDRIAVRTVLASVSDKAGLESLVAGLLSAVPSLRILSTGGTHAAIAAVLGPAASRCLQQVSDYTGQPEMQGGLVKTLDFRIYLGLLSERYNPAHAADLARAGAAAIDMVVVNLYPFEKAAAAAGASPESARGNIDIGGPCMVRAAAKNFHRVAVLTDPADYPAVVAELHGSGGSLCLDTRFALAKKAFALSARYDTAIARYLEGLPAAAMKAVYTIEPWGDGEAAR
jgi:phosphoribosylaminoimidazolecarboxamide formyltransferase / IMP cyclohydrolase